jgi:imidazolonepropionase-like amidohydrolase
VIAFLLATAVPAPAADRLVDLEAAGLRRVEPAAAEAGPGPVVLAGGTVLTATGARYSPGYVVMQDGRIAAVGEGQPPQVAQATVLDVTGRFVTPGIIDTHSHLGVYPWPDARAHSDGNEATRPTTPGVWAEHSIWPQDPGFGLALAGGITTLQILPGSANLVGGRGVIVRSVPARGGRAMRFPGAPETVKMACGENPKRVYGEKNQTPATRMGNLRGQRQAFLDARSYARAWADYEKKLPPEDEPPQEGEKEERKRKKKEKKGEGDSPPKPPDRDLDKETLVGVLEGRFLPQVHCYRADDMLSFLQVADEFGFSVRSFHHATEAYKIRDVLVEKRVAASVWADWWGFKLEAYDAIPEGAALLEESGGIPVIHSDSATGIQRLNQEAAKAYYAGVRAGIEVDEDDALRWITANPAWVLGIERETGTLEAGKRADVVVWDHPPLSVYAQATLVFVDGALRYDHERPPAGSDFELGKGITP